VIDGLPARGERARQLGLALPPDRMPLFRYGRFLKRWRWVGVFTPELMLCVGDARVGPVPQRWWAVARPDGTLLEGSDARGAIDIELDEREGVDVVSPAGERGYIWTRKQGGIAARATVHGERIEGHAFVDDSAGYHERHTSWRWSAGVGITDEGEPVAWNFVEGVHDSPKDSERTVWRAGEPFEVGPVRFAGDLSGISFAEGGSLAFTAWAAREENRNLLLFKSRYRQPFGTFSGELPGGLRLAEAQGVMEDHDVLWH
jgi:Protein of unknown function (DUF2804)